MAFSTFEKAMSVFRKNEVRFQIADSFHSTKPLSTLCVRRRFLQHLIHGGVSVDYIFKLFESGVAAHKRAYLLYHVCRMGSEGMTTDYASAAVGNQFEHAVRLVHGQRLSVGTVISLTAYV